MNQRILYLPIIDPGYHDVALANKRGLRQALEAVGQVHTMDYLAYAPGELFPAISQALEDFRPTLILTQIQGTDRITPDHLAAIRTYGAPIVNWNGDVWESGLTSPDMLALLHQVDLQLVVNASVLATYAAEGIRAAFWPFGVEIPDHPLPDVPAYDVVFLGNNYSEKRQRLYDILRSLPYNVGIYGVGWPESQGDCNYDFAYGSALYSKAHIAISDNQFPEAEGYLSDRPFQAMAAGCLVLQQKVERLEELTELIADRDYVKFEHLEQLPDLIKFWMTEERFKRDTIGEWAWRTVQADHTWDVRVDQLLNELLPEAVRHD